MVKKRISKRTREQAALICAIAASTDGWLVHFGVFQIARWIGASDDAEYLALEACCAAAEPAEAEARLRTGWSP